MKQLTLVLILFTNHLFSQCQSTEWGLFGNNISNGQFLGSSNSRSVLFKTNGIIRLKADSIGRFWFGELPTGSSYDTKYSFTSSRGDGNEDFLVVNKDNTGRSGITINCVGTYPDLVQAGIYAFGSQFPQNTNYWWMNGGESVMYGGGSHGTTIVNAANQGISFAQLKYYVAHISSQGQLCLGNAGDSHDPLKADGNSMFDIVSTNRSSRPAPQLTNTQRNALAKIPGAMIYSLTDKQYQYSDGVSWIPMVGSASSSPWSVSGNDVFNTNTGTVTVTSLFKIQSAPLKSTPVPGTIENNGYNLFYTDDAGVRHVMCMQQ